jgi:Protein of unknown function (DUF2442)/Helix-turn-helix domain
MGPPQSAGLSMAGDTPSISAVRADDNRSLVIAWRGGAESVVDIAEHLDKFAIFAPLRDDDGLFHAASVGEWGWCVHWSDELEISADTLWRLALEQGSAWLRAWRKAHGTTQSEAAKALGVSPRMWRYYEAGTHLLPKTVRLAAIGFDARSQAA